MYQLPPSLISLAKSLRESTLEQSHQSLSEEDKKMCYSINQNHLPVVKKITFVYL
jgi:hypothetical protein